MIVAGLALLAAAAASIGLRTTSGLLVRVAHPVDRLALAVVTGSVLVSLALRLSSEFGVFEAGLGLAISLAPVGVYDLTRWWYRSRRDVSPWLVGSSEAWWLVWLRWLFVAAFVLASMSAFMAVVPGLETPQ